jgi:hypothetical protein
MISPLMNPVSLSEDDNLRSYCVRALLRQGLPTIDSCEGVAPKTIVQFWHDLDAVPDDVLECLHTRCSPWKED